MIRLELAALIGLAAVLPLLEAPKSLFWALYVLAWFVNRARARFRRPMGPLGQRDRGMDGRRFRRGRVRRARGGVA